MRRERGIVLISALVVVLVIASVAAALLARAGTARMRAEGAQQAATLAARLDAAQALAVLLAAADPADEGGVHMGQAWAAGPHVYPIDAGRIRIVMSDMQGRMNVNWLAGNPDPFAVEAFRRLFAEIDLPPALLDAIRDFLDPAGPRSLPAYLRRAEPLQPRGGPVQILDELRAVAGMDAAAFDLLETYVTALPRDTAVNLNTAPPPVLRAMLHPFPAELQAEYARPRRDDPIGHLRELRDMTVAVLETEDLGDLPVDMLGVSSIWFSADLYAEHEGRIAARRAILRREVGDGVPPSVVHRWTLPD